MRHIAARVLRHITTCVRGYEIFPHQSMYCRIWALIVGCVDTVCLNFSSKCPNLFRTLPKNRVITSEQRSSQIPDGLFCCTLTKQGWWRYEIPHLKTGFGYFVFIGWSLIDIANPVLTPFKCAFKSLLYHSLATPNRAHTHTHSQNWKNTFEKKSFWRVWESEMEREK